MATLVLTTVGGLIGGPVGAMLGGLIGQTVDRTLIFKPGGREGPRLQELSVQTSSYGVAIPQLFGTMRVAGTVIWATELQEHREKHRGGKGQPSTTTYSYSASFAVLLSQRPIRAVHRIWADGKLLRGAAGDFKAQTGFRLYTGSEAQMPDPLIASAEAAGTVPGHRGCAYAVFEDLALADYGNRIPSLTFEVEADPGPVDAHAVLAELSDGLLVHEDAGFTIGGFAASGSLRGIAAQFEAAGGGWTTASAEVLALRRGEGGARTVADAGFRASDGSRAIGARSLAAQDSAPKRVALAHYDPERDYQAGVQIAERPGAGRGSERVELAVALSAGDASALAEAAVARADRERVRRQLALGWDGIDIAPGDRVALAGEAGQWRVESVAVEQMVTKLSLSPLGAVSVSPRAAGGRMLPVPDLMVGTTLAALFEVPALEDDVSQAPVLLAAASGTGAGWRSAALLLSHDSGASWEAVGGTAAPAVLGTVAVAPGAAPSALEDRRSTIEVELTHADMLLRDADVAALDAGQNLALVGGELVQFGRAEPLGGARWRLSTLWRGRRGTEAAIGMQAIGDRFVLIAREAVRALPLPVSTIGGEARILASGVADPVPAEAVASVTGASVVPPAPVHLRWRREQDAVRLSWTRRSRAGWRWLDGADAPLAEESETYRVTILRDGIVAREVVVPVPELLLEPADLAGGALVATVRQLGTLGASLPAGMAIPAS